MTFATDISRLLKFDPGQLSQSIEPSLRINLSLVEPRCRVCQLNISVDQNSIAEIFHPVAHHTTNNLRLDGPFVRFPGRQGVAATRAAATRPSPVSWVHRWDRLDWPLARPPGCQGGAPPWAEATRPSRALPELLRFPGIPPNSANARCAPTTMTLWPT